MVNFRSFLNPNGVEMYHQQKLKRDTEKELAQM